MFNQTNDLYKSGRGFGEQDMWRTKTTFFDNSEKQSTSNIKYKFKEDENLEELKKYIDATYSQHYAQTKLQATEIIVDAGHGEGFFIGDIIKYALRYGKKEGNNKKDLLKILHYAILLLSVHNSKFEEKVSHNETK